MRDWLKLQYKRLKRYPMHRLIRHLASWQPLGSSQPGYTVVIACMKDLGSVAAANVRFIGRMNLQQMHELILVFDCAEEAVPHNVREAIQENQTRASVRVIGYTREQRRVTRRINWGWVYSWLSWCTGIAAAQTRHVILHDLDAMPLAPDLFHTLYGHAVDSGAQFHGIRQRREYPRVETDPLAATFELVVDVEHLRRRFEPFDGFNKLAMIDGRYVDFDTFLYTQWHSPLRRVTPIDETQLVHPTQLICQYTDFVSGRKKMAGVNHTLLFLPYLMHLGGEAEAMRTITPALSDASVQRVPFADLSLPIEGVVPQMWAWMEKQIRRLEQAQYGRTRDEVEAYLQGMIERSEEHRSVGREQGANGVSVA